MFTMLVENVDVWNQVLDIVFAAIGALLTGLAGFAVTWLTKWISSKLGDSKEAKWATQAVDIVTNAVQTVYQTYVEALKGQNKFDAEAQKEALQKAVDITLSQMSDDVKQYVGDNFGDIVEWIKNQIESTIYKSKQNGSKGTNSNDSTKVDKNIEETKIIENKPVSGETNAQGTNNNVSTTVIDSK